MWPLCFVKALSLSFMDLKLHTKKVFWGIFQLSVALETWYELDLVQNHDHFKHQREPSIKNEKVNSYAHFYFLNGPLAFLLKNPLLSLSLNGFEKESRKAKVTKEGLCTPILIHQIFLIWIWTCVKGKNSFRNASFLMNRPLLWSTGKSHQKWDNEKSQVLWIRKEIMTSILLKLLLLLDYGLELSNVALIQHISSINLKKLCPDIGRVGKKINVEFLTS